MLAVQALRTAGAGLAVMVPLIAVPTGIGSSSIGLQTIAEAAATVPASGNECNPTMLPRAADTARCLPAITAHPALDPDIVPRMIAWLAVKTGWEARAAPALQFVEPAQLAKMYFGNDVAADRICPTALYSIARHTVYLSTAWNQDNLHDRSVLLHELVHHLQVLDKVKVDCPALYDRQAFHWQAVWLRAQGIRDPYAFLKLDEFMIYTMTSCPNYY